MDLALPQVAAQLLVGGLQLLAVPVPCGRHLGVGQVGGGNRLAQERRQLAQVIDEGFVGSAAIEHLPQLQLQLCDPGSRGFFEARAPPRGVEIFDEVVQLEGDGRGLYGEGAHDGGERAEATTTCGGAATETGSMARP